MSDKIRRFIECYVPVTACNLKCSYCYVIQQNRRNSHFVEFEYTPEHIGKAMSKERWAGVCFFSLAGAGETLIPHETVSIAENILSHGHYVNITTNGTLSKRFDEIVSFPEAFLERLHFAFSFHYLELLKVSKLDVFFENVDKVRRAGCSFLIQINLCDEYIPYLDEIINLCVEKVGAPPQIAVTRDLFAKQIRLRTQHTTDEYMRTGNSFDSPLFDFGMKNFLVKRKEFCYAGDWSFKLYLHTGVLRSCYDSLSTQNIFKNPNKPIRFRAIGNNCKSPYCVNSTHFMSLGVIPEIVTPSYAELRNRPDANWYTPKMQAFLGGKLSDENREYGSSRKLIANAAEYLRWLTKSNILRIDRIGRRFAGFRNKRKRI